MTKEEAVGKALDYVQSLGVELGPVVNVHYHDLSQLKAMANDCPPNLVETYNSVIKTFRNQWVVEFKIIDPPGRVTCPGTESVSVFDTGEVAIFSAP
jgi:hypothetical protein